MATFSDLDGNERLDAYVETQRDERAAVGNDVGPDEARIRHNTSSVISRAALAACACCVHGSVADGGLRQPSCAPQAPVIAGIGSLATGRELIMRPSL